tara:strand:+ start:1732 stop:2652 length:921 start_codon:yes stop_codon:yes gene_type:complete
MSQNGKVIVTGAAGYLGKPLCVRLGRERAIPLYHRTPMEDGIQFDALTMELEDVIDSPAEITHGVIFHADSSPNACSEDIERSNALNHDSSIAVIDSLIRMGIKPVFASSEAVFGQDKDGPYTESDIPEPVFAYGRQKVAVENYLRGTCDDYLIIRIARVYGSDADDLTGYEDWLDKIAHGGTIRCADDQIMSPACRDDAVEGTCRLIDLNLSGIYHLPGARPILRIDLLQLLIDEVRRIRPVDVVVERCSLHDFEVIEPRPLNSTMESAKIIEDTGLQLTPYETIVQRLAERFRPVGVAAGARLT